MADLEVLPDGGEEFRLWAVDVPAIAALVARRIATSLSGTEPAIRFSVASDAAGAYGEGQPLVLVECWGRGGKAPDDGTASLLARTVAAAATSYPGGLHACSVEQGPYRSNDDTTGRPRWIVGLRLTTFA